MVEEAFAEVGAVEVNIVEEEEVTVLEVMGVIVLEDTEVDMGVLAMALATFVDKLMI